MGNKESLLRRTIAATIGFAAYMVLIFLSIFPHLPVSTVGWLIVIFVGIPAALLVQWIGELLFNERFGKKISRKPISLGRMTIAIFVAICYVGLAYLAWTTLAVYVHQFFL